MSAFADVQRPVLQAPCGDRVAHVVLTLPSGEPGRAFLTRLADGLCVAYGSRQRVRAGAEVSVGLTFRGLQALQMPPAYLALVRRVSRAFAEGAPPRAAAHLGDASGSAAEHWRDEFALDHAHVLISVHASGACSLGRGLARVRQAARLARVPWRDPILGESLPPPAGGEQQRWVHFGYRDGLSKVRVRGLHRDGEHEPGEFICGRKNNHGANPWQLPNAPQRMREFFRDGSFGVLRMIEQDVPAFESRVDAWARQVMRERSPSLLQMSEQALAHWRDYVKAKLCGRWPDGRLFDAAGEQPEPGTETASDFTHAGDAAGLRCPLGAHIRRMSPREAATADPGVVHARSRPLIRRGLPYTNTHGPERGLLGWFFCASIEDQFEHLLGQWADRPPLGVNTQDKDPLIGRPEGADDAFMIERVSPHRPHRLTSLQPFCTTRGTLYAFYPSRQALRRLADEDYDLNDEPSEDSA